MSAPDNRYWNRIGSQPVPGIVNPLWRAYCDQLHARLVNSWTNGRYFRAALKTDLFEESLGEGLVPTLLARADLVHGIDLASEVVVKAATAHRRMQARVADVRHLDLPDESVDLIVSTSTLDHFQQPGDIECSLAELTRVLAPGGLMLVTLDNPRNPVVGLRNRLPKRLLGRTVLAPYFVGHTLALEPLAAALQHQGLHILQKDYLMHVPRIICLHLCRLFSPSGIAGLLLVRWMLACEKLAGWPGAPLTGHFVAVLARKPAK